jgi:aspartate carbamoyltransferase catalytic subunit
MVISGYCDAIVIRHPEIGTARIIADSSRVPVINGGDGHGEHPSQALLDVFTIQKELKKQPNNIKIAMIGDLKYGRTVHSLAKLLSMYKNIDFRFVAPPEVQMPSDIIDYIENKNNGHRVTITEDLQSTMEEVEVVYSTRIQQERFPDFEKFSKSLKINRIDAQLISKLKNKPVILHPLPRDSRPAFDELSHDLNDYENLAIFKQTDNGIPVRMAIFCTLLGITQDQIIKNTFEKAWMKS